MASSSEEEEAEASERTTFASLPHALALRVLARLPADARARAACVATSWRTTTDDVSLWTRLDLSSTSGVTCTVNEAALRGAAAKARGSLTALDVSVCPALTERGTALLAVVTANAGALRELRVCDSGDPLEFRRGLLNVEAAEALLRAAPLLRVCELGISCGPSDCPRLLRGEPPFCALSALDINVSALVFFTPLAERVAAWEAMLTDVASSRSLRFLHLAFAPVDTPAELDALVDAVLTSRLLGLGFSFVEMTPASTPALARLLGSSTLHTLKIDGLKPPLLDEPAAAVLADALRANVTLTSLALCSVSLLDNGAVAATLLGALTAHPSLRTLNISGNRCQDQIAVGNVLGALIAANAPALCELDISHCGLDDVGMGPLADALPSNTHLHTLDCGHNEFSEAFVRFRLLPAVRANAGLRSLPHFMAYSDAAREAVALVAARGAAAWEAHVA
jgi:hypothetical protein